MMITWQNSIFWFENFLNEIDYMYQILEGFPIQYCHISLNSSRMMTDILLHYKLIKYWKVFQFIFLNKFKTWMNESDYIIIDIKVYKQIQQNCIPHHHLQLILVLVLHNQSTSHDSWAYLHQTNQIHVDWCFLCVYVFSFSFWHSSRCLVSC